ncbi:MAG: ABC transporter substrate-binding protein [Gammaproteobacteria bacterium]
MNRHLTYLLVAVSTILLVIAGWLLCQDHARAGQSNVTLAMPTQLSAGAVPVGLGQGAFERHGISLATQSFKIGKQALEAVLGGHADLAIVGDTPFVLATLRGEKLAVVASVFSSRRAMGLVTRKGRGIRSGADLAGKTIGVVPGTNSQFFTDALLTAHRVDRAQVDILEFRPEALPDALRTGRVDAVTLWHPELARVQQELGADAHTIYGDDIFVYRFLLVGTRAWIDAHPDTVRDVVAALGESIDFIHDQPGPASAMIGRWLGLDASVLAGGFNAADYTLALDQSLLLTLSEQSRWARAKGLVRDAVAPDYLSMLVQQPLLATRPGAVRIIQ